MGRGSHRGPRCRVENANFQGMPLKITYSGTMTSADEIAFTRNVADLANEKLVAKRAK